jgi:hypothetical protein
MYFDKKIDLGDDNDKIYINIVRMSEPEPRDVYDIVKQIMDLVPDSEVELLYQLRKFQDGLWNQAPELRISAMFWKPLGNILNKNIDSFEEDWQKKILKLFNNVSD